MTALQPLGEREYEVWANHEPEFPHLVLVVVAPEGQFRIIDSRDRENEVFSADNYLEIVDYLSEEDYVRVKGRMKLADLDDDDE